MSSFYHSLKPSNCFWPCWDPSWGVGAALQHTPVLNPPTPGDPAAKLSLSGAGAVGIWGGSCKQCWWGGGFWGPPSLLPKSRCPGCWRVLVPSCRCRLCHGLHTLCPGWVGMGLRMAWGEGWGMSEVASQISTGWHRGCNELGSGVGVTSPPLPGMGGVATEHLAAGSWGTCEPGCAHPCTPWGCPGAGRATAAAPGRLLCSGLGLAGAA